MKDETFEKGIMMLAATFTGMNLPKETVIAYRNLLDDLSDEDFEKAIIKICQGVKEIYPGTNIVALIREQAKPKINMVLLAWTTAMRAVNKIGYDKTVSFEDKVINSVIKTGWQDWDKFCADFGDRDIEWMQKEFERLYELCLNFKVHPVKVLGYHDIHSIGKGYGEQEVMMIASGEPEKRKLIGEKNG